MSGKIPEFPPSPPSPPFPAPKEVAAPPQAPTVYVAPAWEYKHLTRELQAEPLPGEKELNDLGADGWELAAIVSDSSSVHFYFKRQRD
jgi:hypothetical protein